MLVNFRKKERVFPVVLKGTYSIVDTEELKYTIQRAVAQQLGEAGISITVKSDFQAVIEMLEDKKFSSFWESMLRWTTLSADGHRMKRKNKFESCSQNAALIWMP